MQSFLELPREVYVYDLADIAQLAADFGDLPGSWELS